MRILFDDILDDRKGITTITSLNENANYPASNLGHVFLTKRYQCSGTTDTVTSDLSEDRTISSLFYGFHVNPETGVDMLDSIEFRLYDSSDVLLKTVTVSAPEDPGAEHFTAVPLVRKIEVEMSGDSGFFLGKISAGDSYSVDLLQDNFQEPLEDNSIVSRSAAGQTTSTLVSPLYRFLATVLNKTRAEWKTFLALYNSVGKGFALWADPFEDDHVYQSPVYCTFDDTPLPSKNAPTWDWTMAFKESR